ncbi:MAG: hypothetical protein J3T61_07140 [Candidatus Brocadiales bacterium]|nr:hypothetical protein [Candidatus Bathyanammoxibius sp.]
MPKTFVNLVDEIEQELQDSANALWTAAEVGTQMKDALRELSELSPYKVLLVPMEFETRTGMATATTSGSLVDTTETQFLATDVNKVIFNSSNNTWAEVTGFTSTSILVLSRDIMSKDDQYVMLNQDCMDNRQLYLGDLENYVGPNRGVTQVEFPLRRWPRAFRNFEVQDNILTVTYDAPLADSKQENLRSRIVDVNVWVNLMHFVTELTDLAGAVDSSAASRLDTSFGVDDFGSSDLLVEGQEFTVAGLRGRYRLTSDVTMSSGSGTLNFFPPLDNALLNNDVVTLRQTTLSNHLERILVALSAGRAAISKGTELLRAAQLGIAEVTQSVATLDTARALLNTVTKGGPNVPGQYATQANTEMSSTDAYLRIGSRAGDFVSWGERTVDRARQQLRADLKPRQTKIHARI